LWRGAKLTKGMRQKGTMVGRKKGQPFPLRFKHRGWGKHEKEKPPKPQAWKVAGAGSLVGRREKRSPPQFIEFMSQNDKGKRNKKN